MMFRIYRCTNCGYIGYAEVASEASEHSCAICRRTENPNKTDLYSDNRKDARILAAQQAINFSRYDAPKLKRGIGVRKRVLNIIAALVELNKGQPVSRSAILDECEKANLDPVRAEHFLTQLAQESTIERVPGEKIAMTGGQE